MQDSITQAILSVAKSLGGAGAILQLDLIQTTDLLNGAAVAASTWTDLVANTAFNVTRPNSVVIISVRGNIKVGGNATNHNIASRIIVDSASSNTIRQIGGMQAPAAAFGNVLAGSQPVILTGLAPGAHTVKLQGWASLADSAYLRPVTDTSESFSMQVVELVPPAVTGNNQNISTLLGYVETSSAQAISHNNSTVDVTNLTLTITVPTGTSGVELEAFLPQVVTTAGAPALMSLRVYEGASLLLQQQSQHSANTYATLYVKRKLGSLSPGTHTLKVSLYCNQLSTTTISAASDEAPFFQAKAVY